MEKFIMHYYQWYQFEFIGIINEYRLEGYFTWTEEIKARLKEIDEIIELENEFWYLDDNGDRLKDEELFEKSPWSLVRNGIRHKAVSRYANYDTGEAWFALQTNQ